MSPPLQDELARLEAQRAAPTPPRPHRTHVDFGRDEREDEKEGTPDLISFDSKDDLLEDDEARFVHADSASDGEELVAAMNDTPL